MDFNGFFLLIIGGIIQLIYGPLWDKLLPQLVVLVVGFIAAFGFKKMTIIHSKYKQIKIKRVLELEEKFNFFQNKNTEKCHNVWDANNQTGTHIVMNMVQTSFFVLIVVAIHILIINMHVIIIYF